MVSLQPNGVDESLGLTLARVQPHPNPKPYAPWQSLLLFYNDAVVFVLAGAAALALAPPPAAGRTTTIVLLLLAATLMLVVYGRLGLYQRSFGSSARDELYTSLAGSFLGLLPTALLLVLLPSLAPYRHGVALALVLAAGGLSLSRFALHVARDRIAPLRPRRIVIAGSPARVDAVPGVLSLRPNDAVLRIPMLQFDAELEAAARAGDVAGLSWLEHAIGWNCDTLLLTEALPPQLMPAILRRCQMRGIRLAFAPLRIRPHSYDLEVKRD